MNFDEAIAAHSGWKQKLSLYIAKPDKSIDAAKLEKDDQCDLGKWLQAQRGKYASNPDFLELRIEHTNFHRAAADIVKRSDAGQAVSEEIALGTKSAYASCSSKVVQALLRMKRTVQDTA